MKKLLLLSLLVSFLSAQHLPTESVVKIYASLSLPIYKYPWQTSQRYQVSGSGVIIQDNYIITNAHVISNAKYVQVAKDKSSKRYLAKIKFISDQADLALLEVSDKSFFENTEPLKFTETVSSGDNVTVLGYPIGGYDLSTTKGVISRIESSSYTWSAESMLTIQVDASINSGNSGGAAIDDKHNIVGIVMQGLSKKVSDNIGYIIPSTIINTFLEDIKDGKVDGYDDGSVNVQLSINEQLKEYYRIKDDHGAIISHVEEHETALKMGDLLLEVEGHKVFNDGTVKTSYGAQYFSHLLDLKPVGQTVQMKVRRDGKIIDAKYTLKKKYELIKCERYKDPRYIIFGGLVFAPITQNYLSEHSFQSLLFEKFYELKEGANKSTEGVIVQAEKFTHDVNEGYTPYIYLVKSLNGVAVKSFKHFVKLLDKNKDEYTVIDFYDLDYSKYIFDTKKARESFEEIKNIYGLTTDRRLK